MRVLRTADLTSIFDALFATAWSRVAAHPRVVPEAVEPLTPAGDSPEQAGGSWWSRPPGLRVNASETLPCKRISSTMQPMAATANARVSHRGQTSLPADLRHRWGIEAGGEIGFIDLGDAALVVPGGVQAARLELRRVLRDRYAEGLATIDDPDLADQ